MLDEHKKMLRDMALAANPCEDCGSPGCVLAKTILEITKDLAYCDKPRMEGIFSHSTQSPGPAR